MNAFDQSKAIQQYLEKSKDLSSKRYTTCFGHTFVYPCKLSQNPSSAEKFCQGAYGLLVKAHDSHPTVIGKFLTSKSFSEQVEDLSKSASDKEHHTGGLLLNMRRIKDLYLGFKNDTSSPDFEMDPFNTIITSVESSLKEQADEVSSALEKAGFRIDKKNDPQSVREEYSSISNSSVKSSQVDKAKDASSVLGEFGFRIGKMTDPQSVLKEYSSISNSIRASNSYSDSDKADACSTLYRECKAKFSTELNKTLKMIRVAEGNAEQYLTELENAVENSDLQKFEKDGLKNLISSQRSTDKDS